MKNAEFKMPSDDDRGGKLGQLLITMTSTLHNIRERIAAGAGRMRLDGVSQMVMGGGGVNSV